MGRREQLHVSDGQNETEVGPWAGLAPSPAEKPPSPTTLPLGWSPKKWALAGGGGFLGLIIFAAALSGGGGADNDGQVASISGSSTEVATETPSPTAEPTAEPTSEPPEEPTTEDTSEPTTEPADEQVTNQETAGPTQPPAEAPTQAPTAAPTMVPTQASGSCDSSYPDFCIPPRPPDLNCADIPQKNFTVYPPDPHEFDGNHDGVGCES